MKLEQLEAFLATCQELDAYDDVMRVHAPALIECAGVLQNIVTANRFDRDDFDDDTDFVNWARNRAADALRKLETVK